MNALLSPSVAEIPLLMTAYEDSYYSYAASLADVDARLAELSAREATIENRMEGAKQAFKGLVEEMRQQKTALENHLRLTRERQTEIQEKKKAVQQRRERLAVYETQRQSLIAEDEAAATQEAYWQELLRSHQHALESVMRRHETPNSSRVDAQSTPHRPNSSAHLSSSPAQPYHGVVPHPPSAPKILPPLPQHHVTPTPPPPSLSLSSPYSLSEYWPEAVRATRAGYAASLATLVRRCPAVVSCTDAQGNTLLHLACKVEPPSLAVVRCLLQHGAPLAVYNAEGLAPLHVACLNLQDVTHVVKEAVLSAGVSVDQPTEFGETAAHLLASHDAFLPSLEYLIDHQHADLTRQALVAGELRTPLEVAEFYGGAQTASVRELLRVLSPQ